MHIAFDARAYEWTGIGRYIRNLLTQYRDADTADKFTVFVGTGHAQKIAKELGLTSQRFSIKEVTPRYYSWQEQVILPGQIASIPADVWHFTHFNMPVSFTRPYVVTIHDATRFVFPGQRRQRFWDQVAYEYIFASALRHASAAIFVSDTTRREVEQLPLSLPTSRDVIYEGVDEQFKVPMSAERIQVIRNKYGIDQARFVLYVGVWMRHKNLWRLLQAFAELRNTYPDLLFVLTGKPKGGYSDVEGWVKKLGLEGHVRLPGFVPQEDLPALYAGATVFAFPSLYEGFGLPPLEAAAIGVPVVTSNVSSLPEIMGSAAEYVNPEDSTDITRGLGAVLSSSQRREQLIVAGKLRAAQFSWRECAQKTLAVYHHIGSPGGS